VILIVGLLIGPRGNTLKKMETESGAKIAIRGKGSVKEGKGRSDAAHTSNQEEDLHCLIMADTEEKVNKAKKLIHNIIETVSWPHQIPIWLFLIPNRLHLSPKARTSSSATNYVNSLPSTVLSAMTRTRRARTAVRLVIASTTARNNEISLPISFAVSVAMLAIWLRIVQTDNVVQTGAKHPVDHLVPELVGLVPVMQLTESTR
jgi:hypothetical protein